MKEIKELKQNNKVLIKSGKWKIEPENIKPYKGTFIDLEEVNTLDRPINKIRLIQVYCTMIIILSLCTYLTFDIRSGFFHLITITIMRIIIIEFYYKSKAPHLWCLLSLLVLLPTKYLKTKSVSCFFDDC